MRRNPLQSFEIAADGAVELPEGQRAHMEVVDGYTQVPLG
jgi:hypothetical protein